MEFAIHQSVKTMALPGLSGSCPHCHAEVISKCGSKKIWHWAHVASENCDPWFEPETQWHRDWKKKFGEKFSEIRVTKGETYHVADVINAEGIVFEFQNSPISAETIKAREEFYGERMIWLLNGTGFKKSFHTSDHDYIKVWRFKVMDDFESARHYRSYENGLLIEDWKVKTEPVKYFLKQQNFEFLNEASVYYLPLAKGRSKEQVTKKLYSDLEELYEQHKIPTDYKKGEFEWEQSRRSWEESKRPVFIDFGDDFVYRVSSNMGKKFGEGIKVNKHRFLEKYTAT